MRNVYLNKITGQRIVTTETLKGKKYTKVGTMKKNVLKKLKDTKEDK